MIISLTIHLAYHPKSFPNATEERLILSNNFVVSVSVILCFYNYLAFVTHQYFRFIYIVLLKSLVINQNA